MKPHENTLQVSGKEPSGLPINLVSVITRVRRLLPLVTRCVVTGQTSSSSSGGGGGGRASIPPHLEALEGIGAVVALDPHLMGGPVLLPGRGSVGQVHVVDAVVVGREVGCEAEGGAIG